MWMEGVNVKRKYVGFFWFFFQSTTSKQFIFLFAFLKQDAFFLFMIWNINNINRSKWTVSTFLLWKFHNLYWVYYASLKVWGYLTMWHAVAYSSSFCYTHKLYLSRHSSASISVILMAQRLVKKRGNLHSFLSRH